MCPVSWAISGGGEMKLWICGQYREGELGKAIWDFQGVFSSKENAIKACKNPNYFVAPAILDKELPSEPTEWPDVIYPIER